MHFEVYRSGLRRHWRWRLRAANGKIIANSGEGYKNRADIDSMIQLLKRGVGWVDVEEKG